MRKVVIGLIVLLVLGLALVGCDNGTTTKEEVDYFSFKTDENLTLNQLIKKDGGALFQSASRSLRFFDDGTFQNYALGLFNQKATATQVGSRYIIDGNTIKFYRPADADAAPFYTITYTLEQHILEFVTKADGAATAPTTTMALGRYSYGKLPSYKPD